MFTDIQKMKHQKECVWCDSTEVIATKVGDKTHYMFCIACAELLGYK